MKVEYWENFTGPVLIGKRALLKTLLYCVALMPVLSFAQGGSALTSQQVRYFVSFFERIGSADVSPDILHHNEVAIERIFGLNASEATALRSAAQSYRAKMTDIRQSEKAIIQSQQTSTASGQASIAQLVEARNTTVASLAAAVLAGVRPAVASRILDDAQNTISLRSTMRTQ